MKLSLLALAAMAAASPLFTSQFCPSCENQTGKDLQHHRRGLSSSNGALFHIQLDGYELNYGYAKHSPEDLRHGQCAFHDTRAFLLENAIRPDEEGRFNAEHSTDSRFKVTVRSNVPEGCVLAITNRWPGFDIQTEQLLQGCGVGGLELKGRMQESVILRQGFYVQYACGIEEITAILPTEDPATTTVHKSVSTTGKSKRSTEDDEDTKVVDTSPTLVAVDGAIRGPASLEDDFVAINNSTWSGASTMIRLQKCKRKRSGRKCPMEPYNGALSPEFCLRNRFYSYDWQEFRGDWEGTEFPSRDLPGNKLKVSSLQSCVSVGGCPITTSTNGMVTDDTSSSTSSKNKAIDFALAGAIPAAGINFRLDSMWSHAWTSSSDHSVTSGMGWTNGDQLQQGQQGFLECQTTANLRRYRRCHMGQVEEQVKLVHQLNNAGLAICFINLVKAP